MIPAMNPNGPVPPIAWAFNGITVNGVSLDITSVADLQTMLEALQSEPPAPFASLPKNRLNQVSATGFWSLRNPYWPPLPGNFYGADVWLLGNGSFILDDRQIDYAALQAAADEEAALTLSASPMMRMSMMSSLSSTYAYGNPVYLTNLVVTTSSGITAAFDIAGGTNFVPYDILSATNIALPPANWNWLGIGYTSNRYSFSSQPNDMSLYILAKPSKTMTVGFGNNDGGQCDVPYGLTNVVMVAGGRGHSLALKADGTVIAWGANDYGQTNVPANLTNVAMVSGGWGFNLALLTNGTVRGWGLNIFGQTSVPTDLTNATVISAGNEHSLALRNDGTVVAWGYNSVWGETNVPTGLTNITAISAGFGFSLVVSNGYVIPWGYNGYGQCNVPAGLSNAVDVAAGVFHSLALKADGSVIGWGRTNGEANVPVGLSNVVAIAAGGDYSTGLGYSMALKKDGNVVMWGGSPAANPVGGLNNVIGISAGADHALALRTGPPTSVITLEPADEYQVQGSNVTFTARGAGLYGVTYQWQTNGVNLSGATNAALTLTNVQPPAQLLAYRAVVGNELGSIVSSNAIFYFVTPPIIISQAPLPTNQIVIYQTNVTLSVVATAPGTNAGFPLSYQWQFNGANIFGKTSPSLTFPATAAASGVYSVLVSNAAGSTNAAWQVAVVGTNGLQIVLQPTNQYQIAGGSVSFVAGAVSTNAVTYQWQFNGTNISGANNSALVLTNVQATNQGAYSVMASDSVHTFASSNASFILVTPPVIVSQTSPSNQVALANSSATLKVSASAPGLTNGFPLRYQWQFNASNIFFQTSSNYTFNAVNSGIYTVIITNAAGATNVSWSVTVLNPGNSWGWGENSSGQATVPSGVTNITALAAGGIHSLAVLENGTIAEWGEYLPDDFHSPVVPTPLGTPPTNSDIVAVAAGIAHDLALRADGTVIQWGLSGASGMANFPTNLTGVKAISAGVERSLALLTNGTVVDWGSFIPVFDLNIRVPADLTNATAISCGAYHNVALRSDGTVVSWGYNTLWGETNVPSGLSNVVAVAGGGRHSLALKADGTVVAWGDNTYGQCNVPAGLSNVMTIAAGGFHNVAVKNDGTMVSWGDNSEGQTNTPAFTKTKLVALGDNHTVASIFAPTVMYPVDVTKDLLLIYNTNSQDSSNVCAYYLAHRPGVGGANVLGINCTSNESIALSEFTNSFIPQIQNWLASNPTKRPQYVIFFEEIPSLVTDSSASLQYHIYSGGCDSAWRPFVTSINMNGDGGTNDCIAYINKLATMGVLVSSNSPILSASVNNYGNTNYILDNVNNLGYLDSIVSNSITGLVAAGVQTNSISYLAGFENGVVLPHLTNAVNVAGYICWGWHSSLGGSYPLNKVQWSGNSSWWIIRTEESFNGQRGGQFLMWFSSNAFGGTNYSNTPIGGPTYVNEPQATATDNAILFELWASSKSLAICCWAARNPFTAPYLQVVGDPFVTR